MIERLYGRRRHLETKGKSGEYTSVTNFIQTITTGILD